jgi:hypothetical protein
MLGRTRTTVALNALVASFGISSTSRVSLEPLLPVRSIKAERPTEERFTARSCTRRARPALSGSG